MSTAKCNQDNSILLLTKDNSTSAALYLVDRYACQVDHEYLGRQVGSKPHVTPHYPLRRGWQTSIQKCGLVKDFQAHWKYEGEGHLGHLNPKERRHKCPGVIPSNVLHTGRVRDELISRHSGRDFGNTKSLNGITSGAGARNETKSLDPQ